LRRVSKRRLDTLLAERGLADSRTSAAASVRAGRVRVGRGGEVAAKPSQLVAADVELNVEQGAPYVSRGGVKLANALDALGIEVAGLRCLDVGASTGGFTDCLLQRGATEVVALDVGRGQLDWTLRNDPRVHVIEGANARELGPADLPYEPDLAVVDVSFISLQLVLPAVAVCLPQGGQALALVKPQFELDRRRVGKGGVVRDPDDRRAAIARAVRAAAEAGLALRGLASSDLPGPKGNRETFLWAVKGTEPIADVEAAIEAVDA
jgi:23S rRNA (cytidine1920-2'-O)/16S rRNA (cytidine1409-2'-O)-methyltransferase